MLAEATLKSLCKQIELFERAATYKGYPRERIVALGEAEELYYHLCPHHYRALQTIRVASQIGKPTAKREDPFQRCESRLLSLLVNIILDAVQCGDLELRDNPRPEEIAFTIWVLAFGTRALMDTKVTTQQLSIHDGLRIGRDATTMLLDAIGFQPLSTEWDYEATRIKIDNELFFAEWRLVSNACLHGGA